MKWGISRGTGGLPGIDAHLGAWAAIAAAIPTWPTTVTGASAGAVVSALQASGWTPKAAEAKVRTLDSGDLVRRKVGIVPRLWWGNHLFDPAPVETWLRRMLHPTMQDLVCELLVSSTMMGPDATTSAVWRSGTMVDLPAVVRASCSIPGIWPYGRVPNCSLPHADGGCSDAVVTPDNVSTYDLWIHVEPVRRTDYRERDRNVVSRLLWAYEALSGYAVAQERAALERVLGNRLVWIEVDLGQASMLEFDHDLVDRTAVDVERTLRAGGIC